MLDTAAHLFAIVLAQEEVAALWSSGRLGRDQPILFLGEVGPIVALYVLLCRHGGLLVSGKWEYERDSNA